MKHTKLPWVKDYGMTFGHIKAIISENDCKTPTVARYDIGISTKEEEQANAEYIVKACNAYPKLIKQLRLISDAYFKCDDQDELVLIVKETEDLLKELGE